MSQRSLLLCLFILAASPLAGCACGDVTLGEDDGGPDGGRRGPRTDECGNGLDDDDNGAIDDGCPCAPGETQRCFSGALTSNDVGACMTGTQTCEVVEGTEWGDWGESDCAGEILPRAEACDGSDADCDGAVDEGCPCTDGMTRGCGDEFMLAPCMPGTQSCREGTWSACEGAVGPSADVCSDDVDNDCDGFTNEGCECPYPPTPERCRDAVDNDCDGEIDEPSCTPRDTDAGVPNDAACSGTFCTVAPRPIAPLSTSTVTSRRPTLRWENPSGVTEARVELCADRACTTMLGTLDGATSARPASDLPPGWVFWRLRARSGASVGTVLSPTWQLWVGPRSADGDRDTSWGTAMDLDGDGYDEIAVSVTGRDVERGVVEIYRGASGGPTTTPAWVLRGHNPGEQFGRSLVAVGDVNGDGYAELGVGTEWGITSYGFRLGYTEIYYGGPTGPDATRFGHIEESDRTSRAIGQAFAAAGDIDGDGYGDLVVAHHGGIASTGAYVGVYLGDASGIASTPTYRVENDGDLVGMVGDAGDVNADGFGDFVVEREAPEFATVYREGLAVYLGGPSGPTMSLSFDGPTDWSQYGRSIAGACDVNGDGYSDVLIGAPGYHANGVTGAAYVLAGAPGGPVAAATWRTLGDATVQDQYGAMVACAGDLDRDGYDDVAVGARGAYVMGSMTGVVWLFHGAPSGLPTVADEMIAGLVANEGFGFAIAGARDADGDGRADLLVGSLPGDARGEARMFSGADRSAAWTPAWMVTGAAAREYLGFSVGRPYW